MAAFNESEQQAAAGAGEPTPPGPATARPPAATLDAQLLMAARRGDSKQLKDLLPLIKDDDEQQSSSVAAGAQDVVVEVDPRPPPHDAVAPLPSSGSSSPPPVPVVLDEDGVTMEGDSLLHVVAACGDTQEYLDCAKILVRNKKRKGGADAARLALEARNRKGDTPLHCAAGAGIASMISCLVDLIANDTTDDEAGAPVKKAFLRMQNECGETALHQAIRAAADNKLKVACIDQLMDVDSELACIPFPHQEEDAGASPLYLAISLGEVEIARHLYSKTKGGKLSYSGPHGRNVLHAAVHRGQALPMILEWLIKDMKPKEDSSTVSLVSRLTSERDKKQKGSTPLHLAASLSGWPGAGFLCTRFPQVWPTAESVATLLLDANISMAYQADDEGSYPIHVAAWSNSIVIVILLGRCPDCATLRDGKGRTFLHVAAEEGCHDVVRYVCGKMPQRFSSMILNAQDNNGDTALHGAVRYGNLAVFNCLLRNPRVRLDVTNKDGMTPLDLSWSMTPSAILYYVLNPRSVVRLSLLFAGAPHGGGLCRPELFCEQHITKVDEDKESQKHTDATQVMSIVAVIIATVTFASAFTLPGCYRSVGDSSSNNHAGTPVLAGSYVFDAFILADTLAFICSTLATFSLVYAGVPAMAISIRCYYFNKSAVLLQSAGRSFVAAFALALYPVLAPVDHTIAVTVCVIILHLCSGETWKLGGSPVGQTRSVLELGYGDFQYGLTYNKYLIVSWYTFGRT
ncbi:unnamed protein product [Miscanthus lutarioriparius]|uniref:PGG domain-containing protein n=1 Tax=Miscanthus lutarioriparius TaxID=422564 RepID=A0A811SB56_9POAL|nr:unnamed protein product [Miscanthus lutarioriparius]